MKPRFQNLALLAHITFSVGWFGAVLPYLALAIAALTSHDNEMVAASSRSMELIGWYVIVPFSLATLLSGLVQSLGTRWGLFRHWWIVAKFTLTIFAVVVLFQHMRDVSRASRLIPLSNVNLRPELIHSVGGLLVLFSAMALSVFKPWRMTPYGRRLEPQADFASHPSDAGASRPQPFHGRQLSWGRIIGFHLAGLVVLLVMLHIAGLHGLLHHH